MVMPAAEQPRTNGGKFAPKPENGEDFVARLERERKENDGGFLVPPPMPIAELNKAAVRSGVWEDLEVNGIKESPDNVKRLNAMKQWLEATAEAGLEEDVRRVWQAWDPTVPLPRHAIRHAYDEAVTRCRKKLPAIHADIEARNRERGRRARLRHDVLNARERVAKAEEELAKAQEELARAEAKAAEWGVTIETEKEAA